MPRLLQRFGPRPSEVAARIRAERERLGISQYEAARLLGVARGTYCQLETTANPQLSTLIALAEALGADLHAIAPELFGRGPGKKRENMSGQSLARPAPDG